MKGRRILAALLALLMLISGAALAEYVVGDGGDSWVRTGPGLGYSKLVVLHRGESAEYLGETRYDERDVAWYSVRFDGETGWVSSRYTDLRDGDAGVSGDGRWVRATARVNVRSGPGTSYEDMGTLVSGECIRYLDATRTDGRGVVWYKAEYYSYGTVWVSSTYSELVYDRTEAEEDVPARSGGYIEATGRLNVRTGPGLDYEDKGTITKGNTATYLDEYSVDERGVTWYKISYKSGSGWVSSRYCELY